MEYGWLWRVRLLRKAALKTAAHKRVDDLIDAVIDAFGLELERAMKSGYSRFLAGN
jgi:hypothetical protein